MVSGRSEGQLSTLVVIRCVRCEPCRKPTARPSGPKRRDSVHWLPGGGAIGRSKPDSNEPVRPWVGLSHSWLGGVWELGEAGCGRVGPRLGQVWNLPKWLGIEAGSVSSFSRDHTLFPSTPLLHKVRGKKGEERGWFQPTMAGVGRSCGRWQQLVPGCAWGRGPA